MVESSAELEVGNQKPEGRSRKSDSVPCVLSSAFCALTLVCCCLLIACAGCRDRTDGKRGKIEFEIDKPYERGPLSVNVRLDKDELNRLNQEFLERINAPRRVYLTPTTLGGLFTLRICVLSFRTHLDRIEMALEDIREAAVGVGR